MKKGQNQSKPSAVPLWPNSYGAALRKAANTPWKNEEKSNARP